MSRQRFQHREEKSGRDITNWVAIEILTIQETLLQQEPKQKCCRDIKTGSRQQFEEAAEKRCRDKIVDVAT